jgi:hypothetical protein
MRPETVIRMRRSFGRLRAERSTGAYCMSCRISTSRDGQAAAARLAPITWARLVLGQQSPPP